jgi:flagellar biosynthesis protein FlhF
MTILTVRANDTATAMDEIVEKLGTDSYIIDTKKVGNEMLVKATNNPVKKNPMGKASPKNFSNMMSKELSAKLTGSVAIEAKDQDSKREIVRQISPENVPDLTIFKEMNSELRALRSALDDMVLTDMAGLSPNLQSTTKVKLQKAGFSSQVLQKLKASLSNVEYEEGTDQFLKTLAAELADDDPNEAIINSRYIFVLGASGSGKTTLSAKFAARIAEDSKKRVVALGQLGAHQDLHMDSLKSFSRLINVPNINLNPDNAVKKLLEIEQKVVVDVCTEPAEALKTINALKNRVGAKQVLTVLISPAGSSKHYIRKLAKSFGSLKPLIACTKTDENMVSPEEFSTITSHNFSIGYFTGTKSILKSLSFVNQSFLAQYLKESMISFSQ